MYCLTGQILKKSGEEFKFPVNWGCNLQSEHEMFLAEKHFKRYFATNVWMGHSNSIPMILFCVVDTAL